MCKKDPQNKYKKKKPTSNKGIKPFLKKRKSYNSEPLDIEVWPIWTKPYNKPTIFLYEPTA